MTRIPLPLGEVIQRRHGVGGPAMRALVDAVFRAGLDPAALELDDGAAIPLGDRWLVLTTDAHVVQPTFFAGGDIGQLAVCGTVNDLAMMGAVDGVALTSSVIVEEGFAIGHLQRIHASMQAACQAAGARIVTGDTKVMGRGELDGIALSTSGVALTDRVIRANGLRPGDAIVATGTLGDHGLTVLAARAQLDLGTDLRSDVAPLNGLIRQALQAVGAHIHAMKDPTRGGAVAALSELAQRSGVAIRLRESAIPVSDAARAAAELFGIDPLTVANEGKALIGVDPAGLDGLLAALRSHPLGRAAACIGHVEAGQAGTLLLDTGFGIRRLIERDGEMLPRIC